MPELPRILVLLVVVVPQSSEGDLLVLSLVTIPLGILLWGIFTRRKAKQG